MIDQINELPEDGLKSSPETSRYIENSRKIKITYWNFKANFIAVPEHKRTEKNPDRNIRTRKTQLMEKDQRNAYHSLTL